MQKLGIISRKLHGIKETNHEDINGVIPFIEYSWNKTNRHREHRSNYHALRKREGWIQLIKGSMRESCSDG